jgi:hypothetical protein
MRSIVPKRAVARVISITRLVGGGYTGKRP